MVLLLFLPDVRAWFAVDRCLDAGGSYDYEAGSCTLAPAAPAPSPGGTGAGEAPIATFVNRVWVVESSEQVTRGSLRVFLSDGTMVMASPNATPALGAWERRGDGLTITEESIRYPVEILELEGDRFRIRIDGPGEPVEILFAPAGADAGAGAARPGGAAEANGPG